MIKMLTDKVVITYEKDFKRIECGKCYDEKFKFYDDMYIKKLIKYFEKKEEYEKCALLLDFYEKRYNHVLNFVKKVKF